MIVASHQPNFMPYMGYFYKMYNVDVFTLSDTVQFSSTGYHHYNYIDLNGQKVKITVPVRKHQDMIKTIELCDWNVNKEKIIKSIHQAYCKAPYYKEISPILYGIIRKDYKYLYELNIELIKFFKSRLHIDTELVLESSLNLECKNASKDICDICKKLGANKYYSGAGAKVYIEEDIFKENGIEIVWSNYGEIGHQEELENLSVLDYVMKHKEGVPEGWKKN